LLAWRGKSISATTSPASEIKDCLELTAKIQPRPFPGRIPNHKELLANGDCIWRIPVIHMQRVEYRGMRPVRSIKIACFPIIFKNYPKIIPERFLIGSFARKTDWICSGLVWLRISLRAEQSIKYTHRLTFRNVSQSNLRLSPTTRDDCHQFLSMRQG